LKNGFPHKIVSVASPEKVFDINMEKLKYTKELEESNLI
jgi:hypothetical protein